MSLALHLIFAPHPGAYNFIKKGGLGRGEKLCRLR